MKSTIVFAILLVAVAYADDKAYWEQQGKENAAKDTQKVKTAIGELESGKPDGKKQMHEALRDIQLQVRQAATNQIFVVKALNVVVDQLNTAANHPNFLRRLEMKLILKGLGNKRDNKSYYLLDGVCKATAELVPAFSASKVKEVTDSVADLKAVNEKSCASRDELDATAQKFVKGRGELQTLTTDIQKNIVEIQKVTGEMAKAFEAKDAFIAHTNELTKATETLVDRWP